MDLNQRNNYLTAMQIEIWNPRILLPYAANSVIESYEKVVIKQSYENISTLKNKTNEPIIDRSTEDNVAPETQHISPLETQVLATTSNNPSFSLQLMQAGRCLLLVDLPTGNALEISDPAYQLLRNILRAAKLPDSPQWLGDIIHWPLFKQMPISQGAIEAQEFLQSYINTYQENIPEISCLWLIGASAILYTTGLNEQSYYQAPIINSLGQTLLSPSLEALINAPQCKALLWQSIRGLIPLWQI